MSDKEPMKKSNKGRAVSERADILEELVRWLGDCLEKLERHAYDEELVRRTVRCLKYSCRAETNPRLKKAIE